jgi:hypothetical protein
MAGSDCQARQNNMIFTGSECEREFALRISPRLAQRNRFITFMWSDVRRIFIVDLNKAWDNPQAISILE